MNSCSGEFLPRPLDRKSFVFGLGAAIYEKKAIKFNPIFGHYIQKSYIRRENCIGNFG